MRKSRTGIAVSVLPGLLMLVLFYSLALHMRLSLGAWPSAIGEHGFSRALSFHAQVTIDFCILSILSILALPLVIVPCLMKEKWRRIVPYLALFALAFLVTLVWTQFAPHQFLDWWRD